MDSFSLIRKGRFMEDAMAPTIAQPAYARSAEPGPPVCGGKGRGDRGGARQVSGGKGQGGSVAIHGEARLRSIRKPLAQAAT